jgi:hypothetical protein
MGGPIGLGHAGHQSSSQGVGQRINSRGGVWSTIGATQSDVVAARASRGASHPRGSVILFIRKIFIQSKFRWSFFIRSKFIRVKIYTVKIYSLFFWKHTVIVFILRQCCGRAISKSSSPGSIFINNHIHLGQS